MYSLQQTTNNTWSNTCVSLPLPQPLAPTWLSPPPAHQVWIRRELAMFIHCWGFCFTDRGLFLLGYRCICTHLSLSVSSCLWYTSWSVDGHYSTTNWQPNRVGLLAWHTDRHARHTCLSPSLSSSLLLSFFSSLSLHHNCRGVGTFGLAHRQITCMCLSLSLTDCLCPLFWLVLSASPQL